MVAQRYNGSRFNVRRIINWNEWIDTEKISGTKAKENKHKLSLIDNEDLVIAAGA